ncbi:MAG: hypothetical protein K0S14_3827 [Thermomicrobiales bacterium]|nr:hypothetical protein [Thermomicrobiales bacterium]
MDVRVQELALALRERRSDLGQPDRDSRQGLVALRQRAEVYERVAQRVDLDRRDDRVEGFVGRLDTCRGELAQDLRPAVVPAEPLHYRAGTLGLRQQGDQRLQGQRDQAVGPGELLVQPFANNAADAQAATKALLASSAALAQVVDRRAGARPAGPTLPQLSQGAGWPRTRM